MLVHDPVGDRDDVSVDALQVAQHIEMQGTHLQTVGSTVAQPFEMAFGGLLLQTPDVDLHLHHLLGELEVTGGEDRLGDAQVAEPALGAARQPYPELRPEGARTPSFPCTRPTSSKATAPNKLIMTIVDSIFFSYPQQSVLVSLCPNRILQQTH